MARKEAKSMEDYVKNESVYSRTTTGSVMSSASKTERAARMKAKYLERQKSGAAAKDAARRKASAKKAQATPVRQRGGQTGGERTLPHPPRGSKLPGHSSKSYKRGPKKGKR